MDFLSDLDGGTVFLLIATVALSFLFLVYTATQRPEKISRPYGLALALGIFCVISSYNAYCPDADEPHLLVRGWTWPIHSYTYHSGKSSYTGLIACANNCSNDAPRLELNHSASRALSRGPAALSIIYLGRTEEADIGNNKIVVAHPVVQIDDLGTGASLYYRDTLRHWPRVIILAMASLFSFASLGICIRIVHFNPKSNGGQDSDSLVSPGASPNELTSLGLDANRDKA